MTEYRGWGVKESLWEVTLKLRFETQAGIASVAIRVFQVEGLLVQSPREDKFEELKKDLRGWSVLNEIQVIKEVQSDVQEEDRTQSGSARPLE
jgi:hypothetical protein